MKGKYLIGVPVILLALLIAPAAFSQSTGILEGRLTNATDPSAMPANVPLEVVSLSGGMSIIRTAETDTNGKFRIEGLPLEPMLMLRAIFRDANYNKQFSFGANGLANVEIEVYEITASENDIRVEENRIVFQASGEQIQTLDEIVVNNVSDPPRTFMHPSGNFRFSKAPGIEVLPQIRITAPGSSMPVTQSPLESPEGESYYTQYPIKPGKTVIDVSQHLPYQSRKYTYIKKFYYSVPSIEIAVIPMDMDVSGEGLTKVRNDANNNIAVYRLDSIEAGAVVEWTFSGGTPVAVQESAAASSDSIIRPEPNLIGQNAGFVTPVLLLGLILVLWYSFNRIDGNVSETATSRKRLLRERQEFLLNQLADLDRKYKKESIGPKEYQKQREEKKRMLSHVSLLLKQNTKK